MDTRCIEPWRQLQVNSGGAVGPCCYYSNDENEHHNFVDLYVGNSHLDHIRQQMRNNELVPGCQHCYTAESKGLQSPRTTWETEPKLELEEIFVTLGNVCNMACVFCNPTRSSRLIKQYRRERGFDPYMDNYIDQQLSYVKDIKTFGKWPTEQEIWSVLIGLLDENQVKRLHFSGGEPFANPRLESFLIMQNRNQILEHSDTEITITTNSSWTADALKNLRNFKRVLLEISVDGVGDTYNIQRYPSTWSQFQSQMHMLKESGLEADLLFTIVPNILNAHCLLEWHDYFKFKGNIQAHILQDQPHLSIAHLPNNRKALLRQQLEHMNNFTEEDRNNILAELDMPAKKAQANKLTRLVNTWQITRHQNIWETIGWRHDEENTNNGQS